MASVRPWTADTGPWPTATDITVSPGDWTAVSQYYRFVPGLSYRWIFGPEDAATRLVLLIASRNGIHGIFTERVGYYGKCVLNVMVLRLMVGNSGSSHTIFLLISGTNLFSSIWWAYFNAFLTFS